MGEDYVVELSFVDDEGNTSTHSMRAGEYVLGRSAECDICFPDTSVTVSRKHARLVVTPDVVRVEDLESRTGTMVNGRFVRSHDEHTAGAAVTRSECGRV